MTFQEFDLLILNLLENRLSDSEIRQVQDILSTRPDYLRRYCAFVSNYAALQVKFGSEPATQEDCDLACESFDAALWAALAEEERQAQKAAVVFAAPEPELITGVRDIKRQLRTPRRVSRLSLYAALAGWAALFCVIGYVAMNPRTITQPTATVIESLAARWQDSGFDGKVGARLYNTDGVLYLREGLVRLRLDDGAEVLIQGPAAFCAENTNQLYLRFGKVCATIPVSAQGFVLRTPSATVVDYGTEFGVVVDRSGRTETHVFKGEVELRCGPDPVRPSGVLRLLGGFAGTVTAEHQFGAVSRRAEQSLFIRDTALVTPSLLASRQIDLADIVGGGNGFGSGVLGAGIDPLTGRAVTTISREGRVLSGYTPVADYAYVDGVFVPDGRQRAVPISSTGLTFDAFIPTSGRFWQEPFNGGRHALMDEQYGYVTLGGIAYGTPQRPGLMMHANLGLTFDLHRLAQALPGRRITEFTALCGIPDHIQSDFYSIVDFLVLLDGECVFRQDQVQPGSGPIPIRVDIASHHRFLTLVVTDGGNTHHEDWALFALPYLRFLDD